MSEKAKAFAASCGIEYSATFVPQSQSRNANEARPTINWRVKLTKNGHTLETDFMQGCGHLPHYSHAFSRVAVYAAAVREACETGKSRLIPHKNGYDACQAARPFPSKPLPPPALVDVLYSLVSDSDAIEYPTFEEWADNYGYDTDSRSAEKTYRACLEIGLKLRHMLDLDAAREAFEDY